MWKKIQKYFSNKQNISQTVCQICLQQISPNSIVKLCKCQHLYCQSCVTQYFDARTKTFEIIKCLDQRCSSEIDENSPFYSSLPKQTKFKYQKIKRFYFVSKNPDFKLCPKESCTGLVNTKKKPCICNSCLQNYCPKCLLKEHWGRCQKQSVVFLQNNLNYIQCSHCNFIIQKNEGCDHITCKCGYQLCYKCGGIWKGPKHLCVRSKGFQKVRSLTLSLLQKFGTVMENSSIKKFINAIGAVLINTLWTNLVLTVILTIVEIIYAIFSWISPFRFISNLFKGQENDDSIKQIILEEESVSPYLWAYLGFIIVSWIVVRKIQPKYQIKWFFIIVTAITAIVYMLSNLFLIFYYEYLFVSYILQNIRSVLIVAISLPVIRFIRTIGTKMLSNN